VGSLYQAGWDYLDSRSDVQSVMEGNGADNFGSKATHSRHSDDSPSSGRRSLNGERAAAIAFAKTTEGSSTYDPTSGGRGRHGMVSDRKLGDGNRTLLNSELATLQQGKVRAMALERLGFTEADMEVLDSSGANPLRVRFDDRVLQVVGDNKNSTDLARALGWPISRKTNSQGKVRTHCRRMYLTLKRARARRESGEVAVVECQGANCSETFTRYQEATAYCSPACLEAHCQSLRGEGLTVCARPGCPEGFTPHHEAHTYCSESCRRKSTKPLESVPTSRTPSPPS
jgi:hypothetical protein